MTGQKFMRNYRLTVWPLDGGPAIVMEPPLTLRIDCWRSLNAGQQMLSVDIFNLSETNRRRIYQDQSVPGGYVNAANPTGASNVYLNILLEAGYGEQLHRIFFGHMYWAESQRDGTNIVTHIEANSMLDDVLGTYVQTVLQNVPITTGQVLSYLASQFPNLTLGAIGNFPAVITRPVSLNGLAWELIKTYAAPAIPFIDDGKIFIINNNEVVGGGIFVINEATGILQTPRRQSNMLWVTTLLETGVEIMAQMVQVQSTIAPQYNGIYRVLGVRHKGVISGAVCGNMTSTFCLQAQGFYNGPAGSVEPGNAFTIVPISKAIAA